VHSSVIPPVRHIPHQKTQSTTVVNILKTSLQNVMGEIISEVGWGVGGQTGDTNGRYPVSTHYFTRHTRYNVTRRLTARNKVLLENVNTYSAG